MANYSTKQFTYNKATNTFSTFASDIQLRFMQIYPDAADEGLVLVSHVTGKTIKFAVDSEERIDGDLVAWHLVPTKEYISKFPTLKVTIFNT